MGRYESWIMFNTISLWKIGNEHGKNKNWKINKKLKKPRKRSGGNKKFTAKYIMSDGFG